jgi:regulator of protease activity HflC (stomatin/prohibitin superfamily)
MTATAMKDTSAVRETVRSAKGGGGMLGLFLVIALAAIGGIIAGGMLIDDRQEEIGVPVLVGSILLLLGSILGFCGLVVVEPNEAKVLLLFGKYVGTIKTDGWYWVNPFYTKRKVTLRVVNFETGRMKVNDIDGNPIEIAAIVVWRVVETAEACFAVADYEDYVKVQSEAAVRNMATQYPYDSHDEARISLRGHTQAVAEKLQQEIHARLDKAGVEVLEARLSHLAYAQEIAEAMLRRQQAGAIIAARQRIVDGAVGMVEMALERLAEKKVVELDPGQKAAMVSNLLVVLCSEHAAAPVVNAGTLYQ